MGPSLLGTESGRDLACLGFKYRNKVAKAVLPREAEAWIKRTLTFNCSYCGSFFEADVPDKSHLCFSFEKLPNGRVREAIAKVYRCTNTNCSEKNNNLLV